MIFCCTIDLTCCLVAACAASSYLHEVFGVYLLFQMIKLWKISLYSTLKLRALAYFFKLIEWTNSDIVVLHISLNYVWKFWNIFWSYLLRQFTKKVSKFYEIKFLKKFLKIKIGEQIPVLPSISKSFSWYN